MMGSKQTLKLLLISIALLLTSSNLLAQTDSSATSLSFDFGITRGRNVNLWPVFRKFRNPDKSELQIIYPIFSKQTTYNPQQKHLQVAPFFISDSNATGIDKRFISLYYPSLFRYQQNTTEHSQAFKFLELAPYITCFGLNRSASGLQVENNLFFFIWYKRNQSLNETKLTVFPIYWYVTNGYKSSHYLFPLYYQRKSKDEKKLNIALLYNFKKTSDKTKYSLFPILWHRKELANEKTTTTIFPLYWSKHDKNCNNTIVLPLLYSFKNPEYSSLTLLPLFSAGHSPGNERNHLELMLIYWHYKNSERISNVVFPIWWSSSHFSPKDTLYRKCLFPIYWSSKNNERQSLLIFPFIYRYNDLHNRSLVILPLYAKGVLNDSAFRYMAITPLYWHITKSTVKQTTKQDILFPLLWSQRTYLANDTTRKSTLFPLYWSSKNKYKDNKVLFPILFSLKDTSYQSFTLLPLFSKGHSSDYTKRHLDILTFYWHNQSMTGSRDVVFPLWWSSKRYLSNDTIYNKTLFPLYWATRNKCQNNKILFPILYSLKDTSYQSFTLLPLFSKGHSSDYTRRHLDIMTFYWHNQSVSGTMDVVFPLWWSNKRYLSNDTISKKILFPLYWSVRSRDNKTDILFPVIYKFKNPLLRSLTLFPFYSAGGTTDTSFRYQAITPLYWKTDRGQRSTRMIIPIYWSNKDKETSNKVLFPLLYNLRDASYHSLTLLPLFSTGESADSIRKHFELLQIYWHFRSKGNDTQVLFPLWWNVKTAIKNDTLQNRFLLPIYWSLKNKSTRNTIIFPLAYKFSNYRGKSFTLFPIYSYSQSVDSTWKLLAITPLYWHLSDDKTVRNIVLPILWTKRKYEYNDTINNFTLLPLYWSKKNNHTNNKTLFPLIYSYKNDRYHSFTLFPLYSAGHATKSPNRYRMITPLGGYFKNEHFTRTYLFPLFHVKKSPERTKSTALWILYRKIKKENYTKSSILWPICERLKEENHSAFRIAPIIWFSKTDTSTMSSVQPFYYHYTSQSRKTFILSWFLYKHQTNADASSSSAVLWRLLYREKYSNGDFETRFLHLIYANIKKQGHTEISLFPLYNKSTEPNGDRSKAVFFGFYNNFTQYIPEIKESYKEERIFWFMRLRSNYNKLKSEGKAKYLKRK